jgi:hypothetical protein
VGLSQEREGEGEKKSGGAWAGPGKRWSGSSPKEQEGFLFIQINFKLVQTVLIKRWTYQAQKNLNKIFMEIV